MFTPGPMELLIILGIFLLLFGSAKLPLLAHSMGQSINQFKLGMREAPTDEVSVPDA